MPTYKVTMLVEFQGEFEADSPEHAEELAIYDHNCFYQGVDSIETEELEEEEEEE